MISRGMLLLLLLGTLTRPAAAHEYWLAPSRYQAAAGDVVEIEARVGTGFRGEVRPFATERAVQLMARGPREVDLLPATADGAPLFARFRPADERGTLIAYESNFTSITLPADEFDRYLELEGLPARARADTSAGRERYARCAKTWIDGSDATRVTKPVGLTYELVPLANPAAVGALRVRALWQGEPLAGALVRAWRQPLDADAEADSVGPLAEARTGKDGIAVLPLASTGVYLLSTVHMERAVADRARPPADWESYWASLTFERR